jgi:hypothetical protein
LVLLGIEFAVRGAREAADGSYNRTHAELLVGVSGVVDLERDPRESGMRQPNG